MKWKIEGPGEPVLAGMGVGAVAGFKVLGTDARTLTSSVSPASGSGFFRYGLDVVLELGFNPLFARRASFSGLIFML
jgi:hypothetical protein